MARLRLRVAMAAFQTSSETRGGTEAEMTRATVGLGRPTSVLEDAPVDGIDDEVADMTGAPEALGATASDAATIAAIGGGDAERVELGRYADKSSRPRPGGDRCA